MGDTISADEKKGFEEKLHFVQQTEDPSFGPIEIYRFKESPYEYIMDYVQTFIEGDHRFESYAYFINKLQEKEHKNLAKLHFSSIRKEKHMCIKDIKVHTFCNYYNFTLRQAIEMKKGRESRFSEAELTYIMFCLLDLAVYLQGSGIVLGDYRSDKIYLSPEGYIKMFSLEVNKENKHSSYYKALVDKSLIENLVLAPEYLFYINKLEYEPPIDIFKADVFSIGMIILELMTLDKIKFYYNQDKTGLKMGRISFDLSSFASEYSPQFLEILRSCLIEDPRERTSLETACRRIEELRKRSQNVSYCIRLHEEEDNSKKKYTPSTKGQYILTGIEKRLTPSPIISMNSSSSTGFSSKTRTQNWEEPIRKMYQ